MCCLQISWPLESASAPMRFCNSQSTGIGMTDGRTDGQKAVGIDHKINPHVSSSIFRRASSRKVKLHFVCVMERAKNDSHNSLSPQDFTSN